jgi:hypothetical protein
LIIRQLLLGLVVSAIVAAPASATTLGVEGSTLRLDGSAATGAGVEMELDFEVFEDGGFFTSSAPGVQPGPGCTTHSASVRCPPAGISVVEVRGPRAVGAQIGISLVIPDYARDPAQPQYYVPAPNVTGAVDAGARDDRIDAANTIAETISCGNGVDSVQADSRDTLQADCEDTLGADGRVTKARLLPGSDVQARAAKKLGKGIESRPYGVDFKVTCPATAPDDSCGGKLDVFLAEPSLPGGRRFFGNATYAIARGQTRPVKVSVGFGASDGETAASYRQQVAAIRSALKKRGRARMRAQVRSGSSRFQHSFSVTSIRR